MENDLGQESRAVYAVEAGHVVDNPDLALGRRRYEAPAGHVDHLKLRRGLGLLHIAVEDIGDFNHCVVVGYIVVRGVQVIYICNENVNGGVVAEGPSGDGVAIHIVGLEVDVLPRPYLEDNILDNAEVGGVHDGVQVGIGAVGRVHAPRDNQLHVRQVSGVDVTVQRRVTGATRPSSTRNRRS
jgi:hypothetical protein